MIVIGNQAARAHGSVGSWATWALRPVPLVGEGGVRAPLLAKLLHTRPVPLPLPVRAVGLELPDERLLLTFAGQRSGG